MTEPDQSYGLLMAMMGLVTLATVPIRAGMQRLGLPATVGFILLGLAISQADRGLGLITDVLGGNLKILAQIGIIVLLFRVGLESNLDRLARQLRNALLVWLPNMGLPGLLVFITVWLWPGMGMIPAIFAAVAATATSIGVSVAVWEDAGVLDSDDGALMLDVAELDDLSAVVLLSVILAIVPVLSGGDGAVILPVAAMAAGWQLVKIAAFCAGCYLFSRYVEPRLSQSFAIGDSDLGPFLFAAGMVFLIAAAADLMGFSMAIGALFAGLAFSRDPAERKIDRAFGKLLAIFGPFFFLTIGLSVTDLSGGAVLVLAAALFIACTLGKMIGAGVPAALVTSSQARGFLIGVSMVPRAEIFLIVMLHGLAIGLVPQSLYSACVLVSLATCIVGPILVARILARPQYQRKSQ
jgi:Kef-type K+ transport system membrane component KefB